MSASTRSARLGRVRAAAAVLLATGLVMLASCAGPFDAEPGAEPGAAPSVISSAGSSSASWPPAPEPSSATSSAIPTRSSDDPLASNSLYAVEPDARACALSVESPRPPLADVDLGPYVRSVVRCLTKMYAGPLARAGITLPAPKVHVFRGAIDTRCGTLTQRSAPAYYCAETTTIYWPVSGDEQDDAFSYARLGYVALAAHEFGHHLQAASGILGAFAAERALEPTKRRHELTRRLELQAQCFEGVTLAAQAAALGLTDKDRTDLRLWREATGDEDPPADRVPDHGTSAAQLRWLARGLDSGDLSGCNTWTAGADSVR